MDQPNEPMMQATPVVKELLTVEQVSPPAAVLR
jgi:hypothetical protein